jgi:hypothetical protein
MGGISEMNLTTAQSYELLSRHGCYATSACDKCGKLLGAVRYTRKDEAGEWCSRECRDGKALSVRKGGRPRKYQTDATRISAERLQNAERQREFRLKSQRNGKPLPLHWKQTTCRRKKQLSRITP